MIEIREYTDLQGRNPFNRWIDTLDLVTQARVYAYLDRLEQGNFSAAKGISSGLFELRLDFGPGYRIYFGKNGETLVILLGGGTKRRQQADIDAAQALWREYKQRKSI